MQVNNRGTTIEENIFINICTFNRFWKSCYNIRYYSILNTSEWSGSQSLSSIRTSEYVAYLHVYAYTYIYSLYRRAIIPCFNDSITISAIYGHGRN